MLQKIINALEMLLIPTLLVSLFLFGINGAYSRMPSDLKPGDNIAILTGKTEIQNEKICKKYEEGYINSNSPDGTKNNFKAERVLLPNDTLISVIYTNGEYGWENYKQIVKLPGKEKDILCQNPEN